MNKPIYTRQHLIDLVYAHAPSAACKTAINGGRVRVLGAYEADNLLPCYAVEVVSKHQKQWTILVDIDEPRRCYRVKESMVGVPKEYTYVGTRNGPRPLIDGDPQ